MASTEQSQAPAVEGMSPPEPPWLEDPVTGIVTSVYELEVDAGDPDIFVCATRLADLKVYGFDNRASNAGSGAGLTYEAAYMAAVGESAERYALAIPQPEERILGSFSELAARGSSAIGPERWALFDPSLREKLPALFTFFTPETPLAWVPAQSLTHRNTQLVPACLTYLPYTPGAPDREVLIAPTISTGAACARTHTEALYKGICELVERDAVMITWRNRLACPRLVIDEASALHAVFRERFDRPGLRYHLWYTALDLGIHSVMGVLIDETADPPGLISGGSAHLDPNAAALKTLLELTQGLSWMGELRADPLEPEPGFGNVQSFRDRARLYASQPSLREALSFLLESKQSVRLSELTSLATGSPAGDLERAVGMLGERGLEVLAVDRTTEDLAVCGLNVVKVMVPELETMEGDFRYPFLGGRRWREVPVRLGRAARALAPGEINPFPHPYP